MSGRDLRPSGWEQDGRRRRVSDPQAASQSGYIQTAGKSYSNLILFLEIFFYFGLDSSHCFLSKVSKWNVVLFRLNPITNPSDGLPQQRHLPVYGAAMSCYCDRQRHQELHLNRVTSSPHSDEPTCWIALGSA